MGFFQPEVQLSSKILYLLLFLNVISSDRLNNDLINSSNKPYMEYVNKLLETAHRCKVFHFKGYSDLLLYKLKPNQVIRSKTFAECRNGLTHHTVMYPLCNFEIIQHESLRASTYVKEMSISVFKFKLHNTLRLKIEVHKIKLYSLYETRCNLNVSFYNKFISGMDKSELVLCGLFSDLSIYPPWAHTEMVVFKVPKPSFVFKVLFDLIAENTLETYVTISVRSKYEWVQRIQKFIVIYKTVIQTYHIVTTKYNSLSVTFYSHAKFKFYDGPGFLTNMYNSTSTKATIRSSGFQCIIEMTQPSHDEVLTFNFSEVRNLETVKIIQINNSYVSLHFLPDKCYLFQNNICYSAMSLDSNNTSYVNVSIDTFNYLGESDVDCLYGGLAFYNVETSTNHYVYQELFKFCTSRTLDWIHLPLVYSTGNKLLVIFYFYQYYAKLTVKISAAATPCRSVKIGLDLCGGSSFDPLRRYYNFMHSKTVINDFYAKHNECFVLQVVDQPFFQDERGKYYPPGKNHYLHNFCQYWTRIVKEKSTFTFSHIRVTSYLSNSHFIRTRGKHQGVTIGGTQYTHNKEKDIHLESWNNGLHRVPDKAKLDMFYYNPDIPNRVMMKFDTFKDLVRVNLPEIHFHPTLMSIWTGHHESMFLDLSLKVLNPVFLKSPIFHVTLMGENSWTEIHYEPCADINVHSGKALPSLSIGRDLTELQYIQPRGILLLIVDGRFNSSHLETLEINVNIKSQVKFACVCVQLNKVIQLETCKSYQVKPSKQKQM